MGALGLARLELHLQGIPLGAALSGVEHFATRMGDGEGLFSSADVQGARLVSGVFATSSGSAAGPHRRRTPPGWWRRGRRRHRRHSCHRAPRWPHRCSAPGPRMVSRPVLTQRRLTRQNLMRRTRRRPQLAESQQNRPQRWLRPRGVVVLGLDCLFGSGGRFLVIGEGVDEPASAPHHQCQHEYRQQRNDQSTPAVGGR